MADHVAQQKSLRGQLIGTWTLVSVHNVPSDGSRVDTYGLEKTIDQVRAFLRSHQPVTAGR